MKFYPLFTAVRVDYGCKKLEEAMACGRAAQAHAFPQCVAGRRRPTLFPNACMTLTLKARLVMILPQHDAYP
ncbi:hypothetical protein CYMTET_15638 [Cymbomonas tetramitiformis]|uniref:Uncharacterized protein n=1 Tax=Cymbomonas tetramitiformis TaxID=36881 RepID=A0AAE0L8Y3_9CHLO|nr:hypothetical protein CYMTET_15638 [Cymbomonas tetramitiformis]